MQNTVAKGDTVLELAKVLHTWLGEDPHKILLPTPISASNMSHHNKSWGDGTNDEVDADTLTNIQQERMVGDDDTVSTHRVIELHSAMVQRVHYIEHAISLYLGFFKHGS